MSFWSAETNGRYAARAVNARLALNKVGAYVRYIIWQPGDWQPGDRQPGSAQPKAGERMVSSGWADTEAAALRAAERIVRRRVGDMP